VKRFSVFAASTARWASGLGRARERDHPHPLVGENGRANFRRKPGDDAEEAGRQASLVEHFRDLESRHGRQFRGLQNKAVACGERQHDLLHREKEWGVEGRDAGDHAERLAHREAKLAGRRERHRFARRPSHLGGGSSQKIEAKADFEAGLAGDRSGLLNEDVDDFLRFGGQHVGGAEEDRFARGDRRRRPGLISAVSGRDGEFGFRCACLLDLGEQFPCRGISALYGFVARGSGPIVPRHKDCSSGRHQLVRRPLTFPSLPSSRVVIFTSIRRGTPLRQEASRRDRKLAGPAAQRRVAVAPTVGREGPERWSATARPSVSSQQASETSSGTFCLALHPTLEHRTVRLNRWGFQRG